MNATPMTDLRMNDTRRIVLQNVSRFYGEVLGVNRVNLSLPPGVTSLVGPDRKSVV